MTGKGEGMEMGNRRQVKGYEKTRGGGREMEIKERQRQGREGRKRGRMG